MTLEDVFVCLGDPVLGDTRVWGASHVTTAIVVMCIVGRLLQRVRPLCGETFFLETFLVREAEPVVIVHWRFLLHPRVP